jgi:glutamyl-Q tRNA(Asp) synthetase
MTVSETTVVTRFAPSPTGRLHLGHAFSALFAWQAAKSAGGRFRLRIEDIDAGRCRPEFEAGIFEDLAWLGLDWEEPLVRQSERLAAYESALAQLDEAGLLYPCFCTRKDIRAEIARSGQAPHGPDGPLYPGICRHLRPEDRATRTARGEPHALRLNMTRAMESVGTLVFTDHDAGSVTVDGTMFGDVVLARKDTPTSYHLAVTVDDAAEGVTLVTRGEDLLPATHIHRVLQALLGLPEPAYAHHRLLTDEFGRRFAKRDGSVTIAALRDAGHSAEAVRPLAGFDAD